jgi:intracellular multiplication protein IcmL
MLSLTVLVISIVMNIFLIWLSFFHFPQNKFIATSNAAAICNIATLDQPFINQQIAANFATEAVISIYTYDHVNFKRQLVDASDKYFEPKYRNEYMVAFGDSKNLRDVVDNFYTVSATTAGKAPIILRTGLKSGVFFWRVQVPIHVFYTVGKKSLEERVLATVDVVRTEPSRFNPNGIAVDAINTKPLI